MGFSRHAHTVHPGEGPTADLGIAQMRVLAAGDALTDHAFTLVEFTGQEGPWTVPHVHRAMEESFFVLEGEFVFTVAEETIEAHAGSYVLVPHGTSHVLSARRGGGRLLTLMVPGGLEAMFFELAQLPPHSITNAEARAAISAKYDSIPV